MATLINNKTEFLQRHLWVAEREARRATARAPRGAVEYRELLSEGFLGLAEASERFDPSKGASFSVFARWRVRGRIATWLESARAGGQSLEALRDPADPSAFIPDGSLPRPALLGLVTAEVACLPYPLGLVLALRYCEGLTRAEAGAALRMPVWRVRALEVKALCWLRRRLRARFPGRL